MGWEAFVGVSCGAALWSLAATEITGALLQCIPPFAGDDEGVVKLWDSRQAEAVATLEAHSGQRLRRGCCCGSTAVACVVRGGCDRPEPRLLL